MKRSAASATSNRNSAIAVEDDQRVEHSLATQYRTFQQKRLRTHESPAVVGDVVTLSGIRCDRCFCRTCRQVKSLNNFYPSHLKRAVYRCKQCCRSNAAARLETAVSVALMPSVSHDPSVEEPNEPAGSQLTRQRKPMDAVVHMLDRLRRMCAKPEVSRLRHMLPQPKSIAFDSRVARQVLRFWQGKSALHTDAAAASATINSNGMENSESVRPGDERDALRFLPWGPCTTLDSGDGLQPWEIIPLTNAQARWLAGIPPHLWSECMKPGSMESITRKLQELRQLVLAPDVK